MREHEETDKVERLVKREKKKQIVPGRQRDLDSLLSPLPPPLYTTPLSLEGHFTACVLPLKLLLVFFPQHLCKIMRITIILAMLMGVTGSPNGTISPQAASTDTMAHPNCIPEAADKTEKIEVPTENVMATGELNPNHYPARRAAQVVQHYLNTRYGSPFRLIGVQKVHSANAEDVADSGRKYQLELSVKETISNTTENCSAELFFPRGVEQHSPKVQASCEALLKIDTKAQEEALYQEYKRNQSLVSAQNLPDSHGRIAPDMEPFWQLGILASSFIMLNESNENTLYNVAQVANITQLATEDDQLKFDCHTLLHDMVSQEIIHWKLLFTWSPAEGVKVLQMEKLPHRHEQEEPPNTN